MSLLIAFGILDSRNRIVWSIADFLYRLTDSVLRPTRNFLPYLGGIDISPWIAVILIQVIQGIVLPRIYGAIDTGRGSNWCSDVDIRSILPRIGRSDATEQPYRGFAACETTAFITT